MGSHTMSEVITEREGGCLHIIFNRPERLNAVNEARALPAPIRCVPA